MGGFTGAAISAQTLAGVALKNSPPAKLVQRLCLVGDGLKLLLDDCSLINCSKFIVGGVGQSEVGRAE